jgi:hypothetical protein
MNSLTIQSFLLELLMKRAVRARVDGNHFNTSCLQFSTREGGQIINPLHECLLKIDHAVVNAIKLFPVPKNGKMGNKQ